MTTVYVVTEGDYSSYRIIGVYDTEELANLRARLHGTNVEEYELNSYADWLQKGWRAWFVSFSLGGIMGDFKLQDDFVQTKPTYRKRPECVYMNVVASDESHARKIAQDKFAQWKATHAGVAP